jgi:hypothetical protein
MTARRFAGLKADFEFCPVCGAGAGAGGQRIRLELKSSSRIEVSTHLNELEVEDRYSPEL